jgi:hypothetical protein
MIYREPKEVEAYWQLSEDFQQDPSLMGILDRVRRRQGFTRIETWRQKTDDEDLLLTIVEAHDLKEASAQMAEETNELDMRIMKVVRNAGSPATFLVRWDA